MFANCFDCLDRVVDVLTFVPNRNHNQVEVAEQHLLADGTQGLRCGFVSAYVEYKAV
ncbi:hypothetical protein D9M68_753490 [compost metagenome]